MKTLNNMLTKKKGLVLFAGVALLAFSSLTIFSRPRSQAGSITIVNNSGRDIRHVYFSPPDSDNWGPDQLNNSIIGSGQSLTLSVSCDTATTKVITEDQNGCFLYNTASCSENSSWTITNAAVPDCGS